MGELTNTLMLTLGGGCWSLKRSCLRKGSTCAGSRQPESQLWPAC